jgi:hypothetical protein
MTDSTDDDDAIVAVGGQEAENAMWAKRFAPIPQGLGGAHHGWP